MHRQTERQLAVLLTMLRDRGKQLPSASSAKQCFQAKIFNCNYMQKKGPQAEQNAWWDLCICSSYAKARNE